MPNPRAVGFIYILATLIIRSYEIGKMLGEKLLRTFSNVSRRQSSRNYASKSRFKFEDHNRKVNTDGFEKWLLLVSEVFTQKFEQFHFS